MEESFLNTIILKTGLVHLYWRHVVMWATGFGFIYPTAKTAGKPNELPY